MDENSLNKVLKELEKEIFKPVEKPFEKIQQVLDELKREGFPFNKVNTSQSEV